MNMLLPLTNRLDLTLSALGSVLLHVFFGVCFLGLGQQSAPTPEIKQSLKCNTMTLTPKKQLKREVVKKPMREIVETKRIIKEQPPMERQIHRTPVVKNETSQVSATRAKKVFSRIKAVQKKDRREKTEIVKREIAPRPEERWEKEEAQPAEQEVSILSRSAAPAVENGFTPVYPRLARRYGYEGRVELKVTVASTGKVLQVELHSSSGYTILDNSAIRQMEKIPFKPALSNIGSPIESTVIQGMNFSLQDQKTY